MPVWLALEERLSPAPSTHPSRARFLDRVNYFGQTAEIDAQGRVVIHQRLRDSAGMAGEVDVLGAVDRPEGWNHDRLVAKMQNDPFTDEDARALSGLGVWGRRCRRRCTSRAWWPGGAGWSGPRAGGRAAAAPPGLRG